MMVIRMETHLVARINYLKDLAKECCLGMGGRWVHYRGRNSRKEIPTDSYLARDLGILMDW